MPERQSESFFSLTPERVLDAVEVGGRRATGYAFALNSLENRVYEVELEDETRLVAKFYRPGRWSREAILDEHAFLRELGDAEVPVVPPIELGPSGTLGEVRGEGGPILYAAFPKVRGRPPEELDDGQLAWLGRLLARLHLVGEQRPAPARPRLTPESYGTASLAILDGGALVHATARARYFEIAKALVEACRRAFSQFESERAIRLHGDCHLGNLLWGREGPMFVDFDDFLSGPAVQDLWLIAPGADAESERQRALIVAGYETLRAFDRRTLRLVEPLRALRILRYAAWIAQRYDDPAFQRAFPDFLEFGFWQKEVRALEDQLARLTPS